MKKIKTLSTILLFLVAQFNAQGQYPPELDKLVPNASFVFKGKIVLLQTVTTDEDDVSNAAVVMVSNIIDAPEALRNSTGRQITVRFMDSKSVKVGEEKLFFTDPYWIGDAIGVREKGSVGRGDKLFDTNEKELAGLIQQARSKQDDEELKKKLDQSKLVISGRVTRTYTPKGYKRGATEHDPEWMEADILVDEFIKGKTETKTVRVLYASSKDLMFEDSPKLKEGDEGVFIIQAADLQVPKILNNDNMIIDPTGFFRGKQNAARIKSLVR